MNEDRVSDYLDEIREAARDASSFIEGFDEKDFLADRRTQKAVVMSLMIIGEAAAKLIDRYPEFVERNAEVAWQAMRGTRNRIAHGYSAINLSVVWDTAQSLPDLIAKLEMLA